jgi:hypothetical protein
MRTQLARTFVFVHDRHEAGFESELMDKLDCIRHGLEAMERPGP